jgi:hypothetical protein
MHIRTGGVHILEVCNRRLLEHKARNSCTLSLGMRHVVQKRRSKVNDPTVDFNPAVEVAFVGTSFAVFDRPEDD